MDENLGIILVTLGIIIFIGLIFLITNQVQKYNREQIKKRKDFAMKNGFEYNESLEDEIPKDFKIFTGAWDKYNNLFKKDKFIIFEYSFHQGKYNYTYSILQYKFNKEIPSFTLNKQNILHNISKIFGYQDIDFKQAPKFSKEYLLRGKDESKIKSFFSLEKLKAFENLDEFNNIEVNNNVFMTYTLYKLNLDKYDEFIEKNKKIIEILEK